MKPCLARRASRPCGRRSPPWRRAARPFRPRCLSATPGSTGCFRRGACLWDAGTRWRAKAWRSRRRRRRARSSPLLPGPWRHGGWWSGSCGATTSTRPGCTGLGFPADRLIQVQARNEAQVLAALEDALGSAGVAAAVGEAGVPDLTAGRRLQLACERRGATGFLIRRRPFGGSAKGPGASGGSAAATRWTVGSEPSVPQDGDLGLGPPRWRAALTRCRGGRTGDWILEMSDGAYPLRVVAALGDRQLEAPQPWRRAS